MHRGKPCEDTGRRQPRTEVSEDTKPADIFILDFWPPEVCGNAFLLFKPLSLWCFVMAARANEYISVATIATIIS